MSKKAGQVPDAWEDDDWETQADKAAADGPTISAKPSTQPQQPPVLMSRAERLAQHAESNRKIWESAEAPSTQEPHHFLMNAQSEPPLATPFKPAVKVLSRRPAKQMVQKRDPVTGLSQMTLEDDDDDDESKKGPKLTPEEIRAKQQREREEKQRRYEETRAKIFGTASPSTSTPAGSPAPSSGASTPGTTTPPGGRVGDGSAGPSGGRGGRGRGRGRGRGSYNNYGHNHNLSQGHHNYHNYNQTQNFNSSYNNIYANNNQAYGNEPYGRGGMDTGNRNMTRQHIPPQSSRELYDPNYSPRSVPQTRGSNYNNNGGAPQHSPSLSITREEDQIIRKPRGPDSDGRGGFGFARRGGAGGS